MEGLTTSTMEGLTTSMSQLTTTTTNELRTLPNGLEMKCMPHPDRPEYTLMTITGNLILTGIQFVGDIAEHPNDIPLTVLHLNWILPDSSGGYRVHVFGSNGALAVGTMQEIAWNKQVLSFNVRNTYKNSLIQQFERV